VPTLTDVEEKSLTEILHPSLPEGSTIYGATKVFPDTRLSLARCGRADPLRAQGGHHQLDLHVLTADTSVQRRAEARSQGLRVRDRRTPPRVGGHLIWTLSPGLRVAKKRCAAAMLRCTQPLEAVAGLSAWKASPG
jgi:hypothetical protein